MKTTCGALIIADKRFILICHPTRHAPNQWDIVKGQVDPDESKSDAMHREFLEETGVNMSTFVDKLIDYSDLTGKEYVYKHKKKKLHGFIGIAIGGILDVAYMKCTSVVTGYKNLPPFPEVDAFAWIDIADMDLLHESQQHFIHDVMKNTEYLSCAVVKKTKKSHIYG